MLEIIERLRQHKSLRCPIVCIPEAAPGLSASKIADDIQTAGVPGLVVMSERAGYLEGVVKDNKITFEYYNELEKVLRTGCLTFWDKVVTARKDDGKFMKPEKEKARLAEMAANLKLVPIDKNREHGDMRYTLTAKVTTLG